MKKYELTPEGDLFRIKALKDFTLISGFRVKKGQKGGLVSGEHNLSQAGKCWINLGAIVAESARVCDNAFVYGKAMIYGNAEIFNNAKVYDNASVYDNAKIYGRARVCGDATIGGVTKISGSAKVGVEQRLLNR